MIGPTAKSVVRRRGFVFSIAQLALLGVVLLMSKHTGLVIIGFEYVLLF